MEVDRRLFIVGLCEGDLMKKAQILQKIFSDRYRLYRKPLPTLHITLEVVEGTDQKTIERIREAIYNASLLIPAFIVRANGFTCFPPPYKSLGLLIEKNEELISAITLIREQLEKLSIKSVNPFGEEWIYHLTVVNTFLADRQWSEAEFNEACSLVKQMKEPLSIEDTITKISLWHPIKDKESMEEGVFYLREKKPLTI